MFLFVLGIIATIVLFFVLGIELTDEAVEFHFRGRQVFSLFGLLICLLGCVRTVPTGCTGILTTFGRVESQTLDAGMHFVQLSSRRSVKCTSRTRSVLLCQRLGWKTARDNAKRQDQYIVPVKPVNKINTEAVALCSSLCFL